MLALPEEVILLILKRFTAHELMDLRMVSRVNQPLYKTNARSLVYFIQNDRKLNDRWKVARLADAVAIL